MNKDDVLKELYDQCEYQNFQNKCCGEDCDYCFIQHALEYIEEEE